MTLIFFIIKLINNFEVIIPFTSFLSEIPKNLTPTELMRSLIKNELYTKIELGTPPQKLDILIDFTNYYSYIIKDKKNDYEKYKRFYNDSSSTFKNLGNKEYFYNENFLNARNSSDILSINENLTNFNFTFLQILDTNGQTKNEYPGILGFGVVPNNEPFHFEAGLIRQLKEKNITKNYQYTLVFNNNEDFNGKIIIEKNIYEEYSLEYFKSDYCLTTIDYSYFWGWNFINTELNSEPLPIKNVFLKPELGIIIVHHSIQDILNQKFFNEKISEGKCYEGYQLYTFYYCDEDVKIDIGEFNFKLKMKNLHFSLNTDDLILKYNNKNYLLIGFKTDIQKQEIYLGYPFFKKYDVIFNQDKRIVGFYNFKLGKKQKVKKEDIIEEKNDLPEINRKEKNIFLKKLTIGILIFFCILLLLYCLFYIYRQIKRKTKGKLLEELNDDVNNKK